MSVIDYVNRTIDLAAFQGTSGEHKVLLRQTLADPGQSGRVVTGVVKLAQRFLIELLTERGSLPYLPSRGSSFMQEARLGMIGTQADLFSAFTRALIDVRRLLVAEDESTDRDDEKFGSAEIEHVEFNSGYAKVFVRLSSLADTVDLILPIPL